MINIVKNQSNPTVLELTSVSTLISGIYMFEFIRDIDPTSITYFTAVDTSTYKNRYNSFNIIESATTDSMNGTINLVSGTYTYNIYESVTPTTAVTSTTQLIISTGKVVVTGTDSEVAEVYR